MTKKQSLFSTIRSQIIASFGLLLVLWLATLLVTYFTLQYLQTNLQTTMTDATYLRELSLEVENEYLYARQNEADFLSSWRVLGFDVARARFVVNNQEHLHNATRQLEQLKTYTRSVPDPALQSINQPMTTLSSLLNEYNQTFLTTVTNIENRSQLGGIESELETRILDLQTDMASLQNDDLSQLLSEMQSNHQKYATDPQTIYQNNVYRLTQDFQEALAQVDSSAGIIAIYNGRVERYLSTFNELVRSEQEITQNAGIFRQVSTDINANIQQIKDQSQLSLQKAQTDLTRVTQRALQILVVVFIVALVATVFIGHHLIQQIRTPLHQLNQAVQAVTTGDFSHAVKLAGNNEFTPVAHTFNHMLTHLHQQIESLTHQSHTSQHQQHVLVQLSQQVATIRHTDHPLANIVNHIHQELGYYHVQIYRLHPEKQQLILAESTGYAGKVMKEKKHRIPLTITQHPLVQAVQTRQVVTLNHIHNQPHWSPDPLLPDSRAEIALPLIAHEQILGVLHIHESKEDAFDDRAVQLLQTIAYQLALALNNIHLFAQVNRHTDEMAALAQIGNDIISTTKLLTLLERAAYHIHTLFHAGHTQLWLWHEDQQYFRLTVTVGDHADQQPTNTIQSGEGIIGHIAQTGVGQIMEDLYQDPHHSPTAGKNPLLPPDPQALLCTPLVSWQETLGIIAVTRPTPFTAKDLDFLNIIAQQLTIALQNNQLKQSPHS